MTPSPAVALNLDQLVALDSQSRFSLKNVSTVVPECIIALAKTTAPWHTLFLASMLLFRFFKICRKVMLVALLTREWQCLLVAS